MSFDTKLTNLLKTNPAFLDDDGELLLAAVQDKAWKIDHELVRLLISDPEVKDKFFTEIEGHWVFNINTFLEYISQKNFLDNSYTRFRNKIGLTIDGKYLSERGEVALVWPYKDCVLEGGQTKEEEKRKEIFFNEILAQDEINQLLAPKVLTNFKRYTVNGEEEVTDFKRDENGVIRENLIIKGNNLIAMHSLVEQFRGQVKLIYIDPPFNTGNDTFGYNDSFNHSTWLTFMKNRLETARDLLSGDGLIFIQCDDNEQAYLTVLLDGIFHRDNHIGTFIWEARSGQGNTVGFLAETHEYVLCYSKNKLNAKLNQQKRDIVGGKYSDDKGSYKRELLRQWGQGDRREDRPSMYFPIDSPDGTLVYPKRKDGSDGRWRLGQAKIKQLLLNNDIDFVKEDNCEWQCYRKIREGKVSEFAYTTILKNIGTATTGTLELTKLFGRKVFDTPKPESLLQRILEIGSNKNELIMDFFIGSGTTAAVAHKMNRQYIGIEQLKNIEKIVIERIKKVIEGEEGGISESENWQGGGNFIYFEIQKINEIFIENIQSAQNYQELFSIWQDLGEHSFLNWYVNPNMPDEAINEFIAIGQEENGLEKQKSLLLEMLDKNQLYVNLSEIDDAQFQVSEADKKLNIAFYKR